ncbi:MAG: serine/threonine-protein kinase RsbW [Acidimicrobiaceae bacterium]|jgi:serine/threonine-protein kinase RsbW|nr:serine/threonine-protein kinase RsbW [Acidimicrobiaceae bacterium]
MSDTVSLSLPVRSELLVLARITAATMAARADFDIEEIEDLRLAVDELCLSVVGGARSGTVRLEFTLDGATIAIACELDRGGEPDDGHVPSEPDDLSIRLIEALVDEHHRDSGTGGGRAWLSKRRSRVEH